MRKVFLCSSAFEVLSLPFAKKERTQKKTHRRRVSERVAREVVARVPDHDPHEDDEAAQHKVLGVSGEVRERLDVCKAGTKR